MRSPHDFLSTAPFDVYELHLFHLVAETGSFTKAGQQAGLTQSAVTRQISGMEHALGVALFERTTRRVRVTAAGAVLRERSRGILEATGEALRHLQEQFNLVPKA